MLEGECNCSGVAYKVDADITDIYVCHCSICQRGSGGAGVVVVVVNNADFRWLRGSQRRKTWRKPGHDWQMTFCDVCGSSLPGSNDETRMYVPVGTVTAGAENLRVAHHIWVDSRAPWDVIGDSGQQHPRAFNG